MKRSSTFLILALAACAGANAASPLGARGYSVLPEPQRVNIGASDFKFGAGWSVARKGVAAGDIAVASLTEGLDSRFHVKPAATAQSGTINLVLAPGSVKIGDALDSDKKAIADQAYAIDLAPKAITIAANAPEGLFYGVQTLLQLIKPRDAALWLPEGRIEDWPDLRLRQIYWDDAHHLDRPEVLRNMIRQAAFYKINGVALKLEGHFQYKSQPAIVEPYALTPAEYQALTDYGLKYHVQLVPFLDGPAHIAFILKHPEYAKIREYPDSNYEACAVNPDTYKMYEAMYQDLLDANKGGKYFYLSTDEAYYVGMANNEQCTEGARAKELGSVGKMLGEFVTKAGGWLHDHGREVIFWGEFPMKPGDVDSIPSFMISGEAYQQLDSFFKKRGIRQMIYTSTQGEERHFPEYFALAAEQRLHAGRRGRGQGRVDGIIRTISNNSARKNSELMGVVNAGWADSGLHPETFWLGYTAGTAASWNPGANAEQGTKDFYNLFYGWSAVNMNRVYELMSTQAQFWSDSWETGPSMSRKPIWGNSNRIFDPKQRSNDQFLPLPPAIAADLKYSSTWSKDNAKRLELAASFLPQNDELLKLLQQNVAKTEFNRYNLEVYVSVARVLRHNLTLLAAMGKIDTLLAAASDAAAKNQPKEAVAAVDKALSLAGEIRRDRNGVLRDATQVWYKSWYPRVPEANGRKFLHELDDVKDHIGDRTVDLSYMLQREILLPFGFWLNSVQSSRNQYAKVHQLPEAKGAFDRAASAKAVADWWKDTAGAQ